MRARPAPRREAPGGGKVEWMRKQSSLRVYLYSALFPMLENLTARLAGVVKTLRGEARLTESNIQDALREVRLALLEADVALPVVKDFIARIRGEAVGEKVMGSLTPGQALVGVVSAQLTALMGGGAGGPRLPGAPPAGDPPGGV